MKKSIKAAAVGAAGVLVLTGCGNVDKDGGGSKSSNITIVGYSVLEGANDAVTKAFSDTDAGDGVTFDGASYGASGDQSRAVADGTTTADLVHFSLEPDMTRLVDAGLVAEDWKDNDTDGICTQSVVAMVVQKGNPENIDSWDDLVKGDIKVVTPNPASSGSAKWNLLAAYGAAKEDGGSDEAAVEYMTQLFEHIDSLPDSGRDATTAFEQSNGDVDVLLSYENEAILARQSGKDFDYVIPDTTLSIENPCTVTNDASDKASDFLDFIKGPDGQKLYVETGFRPLDGVDVGDVTVDGVADEANPFPEPGTLLDVDDDFGGWGEANDKYFGDGTEGKPLGIIAEIQQNSAS